MACARIAISGESPPTSGEPCRLDTTSMDRHKGVSPRQMDEILLSHCHAHAAVTMETICDMAEIHDLKYMLDSTYLYGHLLDRKSRIKVKVIYAENRNNLRGESPVKRQGTFIFSF